MKLLFFCLSCNFISFNAKWNFAVILSLHDKWVVKTLKSWSYCMINCKETDMTFSRNFRFSNGLLQADVIFKADRCIISTPNLPSHHNCWVSYCWLVGCAKRKENKISIAKPCIYKAAGSGIHEMIFPSAGWTYLLFIIH